MRYAQMSRHLVTLLAAVVFFLTIGCSKQNTAQQLRAVDLPLRLRTARRFGRTESLADLPRPLDLIAMEVDRRGRHGRADALLRELRLEAGLRQVDMARKLGKPQAFVSYYESGARRLDLLELRQICGILGITLPDFVRKFEKELQ